MNNQPIEQRRPASGQTQQASELQLFMRARDGDVSAFEELYRGYHPRLARFLSRMLRRPQMVEEVLNDTMMVVWQKSRSFEGASKLSTWIFGIAYRKALNARSRSDEPVEDLDWMERVSVDPTPEEELAQARRRCLLWGAIGELSADHRTVLDLTYNHEMGYTEIASIMGCPVGTVKTRMMHARLHLKKRLAGDLAEWI